MCASTNFPHSHQPFLSYLNWKTSTLRQNQFTSVPGIIAQCPTLELIDLTNNAITQGCEYLLEASTLNRIYLNNNQLKYFPFDQIIRPIEELNVSENPLESQSANKLVEKLFI